jgi:hypothetical protein
MSETLSTPLSYKDFPSNKLTFITFNYDRSLEHFLYGSLKHSFSEDGVKLAFPTLESLMEHIAIAHVYGCLCDPDWRQGFELPYGAPADCITAYKLHKNIKTFYEKNLSTFVPSTENKIQGAKKIYFLGFGFARENLDIIGIPANLRMGQKIYGTAFGLFPNEIENIKSRLRENPEIRTEEGQDKTPITIENVGCLELLRKYL